ncbi:arabinogalactan endo-1,4-beta-galactosidase [Sporothrix schenckii 1099-18]|uniref:Arabinogalactan endo-beta-1,4-galactanase n=1 Tax=Sporothrix schenckii 1099-18 TaxID=1397361 RepID=A0A0F2M0R6_SPOSC|nr:arabinogalactan endo-1,4-beta-galactosidase [Sporothrix schenckii 1099-18]KJR81746.1 arabinogalactan endo-1,4-beta-galactosidase [Sporothrix schenckii 1099-18]
MRPVSLLGGLGTASVAAAALAYRGVDWSSVAVEEAAGVNYKSATTNQAAPLESILAASGVNMVRQRLWVNPKPDNGAYNLAYNLKLARRARAAGLGVYLDLHYSDTWADPGHQTIPAGWPKTLEELTTQIFNYTRDVCDAFAADAVPGAAATSSLPPLSIISIGNEITNGLLWPVGSTKSYSNIAALLHAASAGVKASKLATVRDAPPPKIMVHLDNGWSWSAQHSFYTKVLASGSPLVASDLDIMGVSYYPFYNAAATLASLKTSLQNMAAAWGKELVVAETDWPTSCPRPKYSFPADAKSIPYTAAGQTAWVQAVANVVAGVAGGRGLFYWEPAWVHNANLGSSCADSLMVSQTGQALSSLAVFSTI